MIKVSGLSKSYGGFLALDDISFTCQPGRVTGFLGPNGAGKTTTMRIMAGLTPASRGEVTIGGHHFRDIPNPGRHVGVLLDASAQHDGRTGREVLTIGARTMGLPESRVGEMLERVSLTPDEAKRRVRNYSLGMRQRLGIAHALLGDPSVLILDEPANGLDPAGIRWMRGLLKAYAERGGTSTHVMALDNSRLEEALTAYDVGWTTAGEGLAVEAEPVEVGRIAAEKGIVLVDLRPAHGGLEELFLELTSDTQRDDTPGGPA